MSVIWVLSVLSEHSDTKLVMKGIAHGACDYLLKPVRIEELKNIWQHVVRRKKLDSRDQNKSLNQERSGFGSGDGGQGATSAGNTDQSGKVNKKRKDQSEDEEDEGEENGQENDDPATQKKPRVVWSVELHRKFVAAVNQLGLEKAVPKKILDLMNVDGLTRENVASHLQKYRLYLKRISNVTTQGSIVASLGGKDSYFRLGQVEGFGDFRTLTGPGRLPNAALSSYPQGGMLGRLNSPSGLTIRGINSSSMIQPAHPQILSSSNTLGKLQATMLPANQNANLFQGIPTGLEITQMPQNKSVQIGDFNRINDQTMFGVPTNFPDPRAAGGSSSNISSALSNPLLFQANSQQTHSRGAFGNQSSLNVASTNTDSFDMGVRGSSNFLDHNRCNENWQAAAHLSKFPSNSLPLNHDPNTNLRENMASTSSQFGSSPADFSSSIPVSDSRGDLQCQTGLTGNVFQNMNYSTRQRWEEGRLDYNQGLSNSYGNADSIMPANGIALDQTKSQDSFIQNNYDSLDDIMNAMIKRESNGPMLIDGEFGFDAYSLGSCM